MEITTYDQAIEYLETFIKPVVFAKIRPEDAKLKDPLDRMRKLLELVGNPQDGFRSILVGGTSGKGSTSYFISHILTTAGYKTGLTISPHLQKINERLQINEKEISDKEFIELLNEVVPAIEEMKKSEVGEPSHFEILIAMAFRYFAQKKVDIAVVEVGLGGRYDATNVLHPLIAVLTNVSLDHTAILGNTVEKIAREKAGIIKLHGTKQNRTQNNTEVSSSLVVITGAKQKGVIRVIEKKCKEVGARLYRLGKDFKFKIIKEDKTGTSFVYRDKGYVSPKLFMPLNGEFQVENASLALSAIFSLVQVGFPLSDSEIIKAFKTSFIPGRFEVINLNRRKTQNRTRKNAEEIPHLNPSPFEKREETGGGSFGVVLRNVPRDSALVLDGAHNLAKMKAFISSLKKVYSHQRKFFIVAFKDDKDAKGMLKEILKVADTLIITEFHKTIEVKGHGNMKRSKIKDQISKIRRGVSIDVYSEDSSKDALKKAIEMLNQVQHDNYKANLIVVTGSLYLVGEVRDFISKL